MWTYDWTLSLSTMFSRLIHVVMCINTSSFVWLNNIPLYGQTTVCFIPLARFHILAFMNNAAMSLPIKSLCGHVFWFLGRYPGVALLDHMVTPMFSRLRNSQTVIQSG